MTRNVTLAAALTESEERYRAANPKSLARYDQACGSMPGGNTRTVIFYPPFPLTMARGEGAYLWDLDGHRYRDFLGEYSAGLYGHSHPRLQAALREALENGVVLGAPGRHEAELAELMTGRFPSLELVRFCNSGTEANLMALGAARAVTGRDKIMVFDGAYHGGVLYFAHGPSPVNAPFPVVLGRYNDAEASGALIDQEGDQIAAILVEPMMGAGGCIPADPAFLASLRDAASRHGILLIFDEVMTSRLAPGGLQERFGVTPDLTSFGKYLGGGASFGAFGGRRDIMARFDPRSPDALPHAGTFNNNVLTMAAGATGLREIFTAEAAEALNARGDGLRARLNQLCRARGLPWQASGLGSLLNLHPSDRPLARPEDLAGAPEAARQLLHLEMIARGFYLARRGYMSLSLQLEESDLEAFAEAFDDFLECHATVLAQETL
ncbi:MAG: aminotransferase class III-fold pyridoxal phosphate-dependent enzyme [Pseudomonadota bacterium]